MPVKRMPDAEIYAENRFSEAIVVLEETKILREKIAKSDYPSLRIFLKDFLSENFDAIRALNLWGFRSLATSKGIEHLKQVLQEETEKEKDAN